MAPKRIRRISPTNSPNSACTEGVLAECNKISMKVMSNLPEVVGVAFVKRSYFKMGLIVAHEGIIVDQKNIIHASQEFEKTVQMNFMEYYFENESPRFDGIMLFSFHPLEG